MKIKNIFYYAHSNKHFYEVFKGGILSFGVSIATLIMGFGSTWIISRYYGADILGYLSLLNSFLAIVIIFTVPGCVSFLRGQFIAFFRGQVQERQVKTDVCQ